MCCLSAVMYNIGVTGSVNFTGNLRTSRLDRQNNVDETVLPTKYAVQVSLFFKINTIITECH